MKNKKTIITIGIIAVLAIGLVTFSAKGNKGNAEDSVEVAYTPVAIEDVQNRTIYNEVTFTGKVHADKEVMVLPKVPGKVVSVSTRIGEEVAKDAPLFAIDKKDVQKKVDSARKQRDAAKAQYNNAKESIAIAKATYERTLELYNQGAVSKQQLEQVELQASEAPLNAAKAQYETAEIGYTQALDALKDTTVRSPINGIVSSLNVEEGEMAGSSQPALTVVDMDSVYVEIKVPENNINALSLGQEVEVSIDSVSKSETFVGKIDSLSPASDPQTQLYTVRVYLDNADHIIKPGMFSKISLKTDVKSDVVAVMSETILTKGEKNYVYVIEDNKAVLKEVVLGIDVGKFTEIQSGIALGEKLVIKGQNYLDDGEVVKIVRGDK